MAYPLPIEEPHPQGMTESQFDAGIYFITHNWTRDDLAHLPSANRYEILDGRLLVTPPAGIEHQIWESWITYKLKSLAPPGWGVLTNVGIECGSGRDFIPDVIVLPPGFPRTSTAWNAIVPALVLEVESRSTASIDRHEKAEAYAKAGIESYWRMERNGRITIGRLNGGEYDDTVYEPGEPINVTHPYPMTLPERPADPR